MKKIFLIVGVLSSLGINCFAQISTIENMFEKFKKCASLSASFTTANTQFTLTTSGDKYFLKGGDSEITFDGNSLYTYSKSSNEVAIEQLTGNSILTNPTNIFKLNINDFSIEEPSDNRYILTPKKLSDDQIMGIEIVVKNQNDLESITLMNSDNQTMKIVFDYIKKVENNPKELFKFDKKKYSNVEIIDFR